MIEDILQCLQLRYDTQFRLPPNLLERYDFCVDKTIIEYDGDIHFIEFPHFHREGRRSFASRRERDVSKTLRALQAGYKVVRIDYTWFGKIEQCKKFIEDALKNTTDRLIVSTPALYKWILDGVSQHKFFTQKL